MLQGMLGRAPNQDAFLEEVFGVVRKEGEGGGDLK